MVDCHRSTFSVGPVRKPVPPSHFFLLEKIAIWRVAIAHHGPGWGPERMVEAPDDWVRAKIVPSRDRYLIDGS
jgi:hypothetical protein